MRMGRRPLARHRAVTRTPAHEGKLTLTEEHDRLLRRYVRIARLSVANGAGEVPPSLRDAVVIWIGDGRMTMTGFETDEVTGRCVAQSWYVELATP